MTVLRQFVFCADDFTGASDTLATLVRRGLAARLYLRPPNPEDHPELVGLDAIGIATSLRSLPREEGTRRMRQIAINLPQASLHHLKVCSTFDSSPRIGNIAAAADAYAETIDAPWVAVIGGQPSLGRYCLFGNLFAAADDGIHRIDRHPVMSAHPITPMAEADLRLHLAAQGWPDVGLVSFPEYCEGADDLLKLIERRQAAGERQTLFDVSREEDLAVIGTVLRRLNTRRTVLCVGASSVAEAFHADRTVEGSCAATNHMFSGPVFAFVGSRSPVSADQVSRASSYLKVPVPADELATKGLIERCRVLLGSGSNTLAHLVEGRTSMADGRALAEASAHFIAQVVAGSRPGCLAIAGGDTSSAAVERLGIDSISIIADFDRGAPLVRAHASGSLDGLPMVLKGGQMGGRGFFEMLAGIINPASRSRSQPRAPSVRSAHSSHEA